MSAASRNTAALDDRASAPVRIEDDPDVAEASRLAAELRERRGALDSEIQTTQARMVARPAPADPITAALAPAPPSPDAELLGDLLRKRELVDCGLAEANRRLSAVRRAAGAREIERVRPAHVSRVREVLAAIARLREAMTAEASVATDLTARGFGESTQALGFVFEPLRAEGSILDRIEVDARDYLAQHDEHANETIHVIALMDLPQRGVEVGQMFEVTRAEAARLGSSVDTNPKAVAFKVRRPKPEPLHWKLRALSERVKFVNHDPPRPAAPVDDEE